MSRRELDETRIHAYLMALYEALKRKRSKFKMTDFRRNFGISPHVQAAAVELGYVAWDTLADNTRQWKWMTDAPTMDMAARVLAGYRTLTFVYKENQKERYRMEVDTAAKGERITAIEQGKLNRDRLKKAIADAQTAPPGYPCPKCGSMLPATFAYCPQCDLGLSPEDIVDMDEELAEEQTEEQEEKATPAFVLLTQEQWDTLMEQNATITQLLTKLNAKVDQLMIYVG